MPKGKFPLRRTIEYLSAGKLVLKNSLASVSLCLTGKDNSKGLRNFIYKDLPQVQYKNPFVQFATFRDKKEFPQMELFFKDGERLLLDVENKSSSEILKLIGIAGGASESELQQRKEEKYPGRTCPSNFGRLGHCWCICQKPGQVPCTSKIPRPSKFEEMKKMQS